MKLTKQLGALALAMALAALGGCGGKTANEPAGGSSSLPNGPSFSAGDSAAPMDLSQVSDPYLAVSGLAQRQLEKLKGCGAHFTVVLSAVDEKLYRRLGMHVSCEAKYERRRLYYR